MTLFFSNHPDLQAQIERFAESFAMVKLLVITGASGTGKSYLAGRFHGHGPDRSAPLLYQDTAGLAENRFESQLFGHLRGSFSGATGNHVGLVGSVGRGTLVLEGLEDLVRTGQARLLRFLQERVYRAVGATQDVAFPGRLIFTSRFSLRELSRQGLLRDDFLYRIAAVECALPGLERRPDDFVHLGEALVKDLAASLPAGMRLPSREELEGLAEQRLEGNLHGLRNLLQQAMLMETAPAALPVGPTDTTMDPLPRTGTLKGDLHALEKQLLRRALAENDLSRVALAKELGLSRRSLLYKLKEHGLLGD